MQISSAGVWASSQPSGDGDGLAVVGRLTSFHAALPHLAKMGRQLIGFSPLFRRQIAVDSSERFMAYRRHLTLQVGFLGAQLVDLGLVIRADRLEHALPKLMQLLAEGHGRLPRRLKLGLGLGCLRWCQIQILREARATLSMLLLRGGRRRLLIRFLCDGQK
ncbi:MAG TPA: hypothetical protein VKR61_07535 [Bryobacteraceae bacterium]|nr:hypothetical protein [Bryobacteraceae bacterium]